MKRQDAVAIAAIYGDEAVFITATGDALRGRTAVEAFERERFQKLDGMIEDDGLTRSGAFVYEWGHAGDSGTGAGHLSSAHRRADSTLV